MADDSGVSGSGGGTSNPFGIVSHDYNTYEKNNYTARPPTFSGDSIEFEWWKRNMYTHIIDFDNELWDILEYGIDIQVNRVGMVSSIKSFTPTQKKIYRKHHRVRGILVDVVPHSEYIKIINKYITNNNFKSLCAAYEGKQ